jgi:hypothetical protein
MRYRAALIGATIVIAGEKRSGTVVHARDPTKLTPSPGTPGEGRGEGSRS